MGLYILGFLMTLTVSFVDKNFIKLKKKKKCLATKETVNAITRPNK